MSDGIELTDDEYDTFMAVLAEQRCQHSHADTACPPPPERAILTDLIEELRAAHHPTADLDGELRLCTEGCGITPCPTLRYADRAEQRLREVSGE